MKISQKQKVEFFAIIKLTKFLVYWINKNIATVTPPAKLNGFCILTKLMCQDTRVIRPSS